MSSPASSPRSPDNSAPAIGFVSWRLALIFTAKPRNNRRRGPMLQDNCRAALPLPFPWRATNFFRRFASVPEEIVTHSAEETIAWGREFASRVKAPLMILLSGDLGSGKTTLTKRIVSGLGVAAQDDRPSPTFTRLHVDGPGNAEYKAFLGHSHTSD